MESYLWKFYNLSWSFTGQREVRGQAALIDGFADTQSSRERETDSARNKFCCTWLNTAQNM